MSLLILREVPRPDTQTMTKATRTNPNQCRGTRTDGTPCQSTIVSASGFCFSHDPEKAEERAAARRRGGENRSDLARAKPVLDDGLLAIQTTVADAMRMVKTGEMTPSQGRAIADLGRTYFQGYEVAVLDAALRRIETNHGLVDPDIWGEP